jgi:hypothetical protein
VGSPCADGYLSKERKRDSASLSLSLSLSPVRTQEESGHLKPVRGPSSIKTELTVALMLDPSLRSLRNTRVLVKLVCGVLL